MDAREIFELLIKADEKLKYATAQTAAARRTQARDLLVRAREEARAIGDDQLVAQSEQRLADLDVSEHPASGRDRSGES